MNHHFSKPSSSRSFIQLTTFMLLCGYSMGKVAAGGKGKVPIYMPIPIPIPMAMGPSAGGAKFHHHQQQQNDDGEGEVKKIYLLQPMPKVQPPPQLKGGFPVQTHIHMPPPMVHQKHQSHGGGGGGGQASSSSYGDTHSIQGAAGNKQHSSSYSEMKILPIVVIPPIAPMPPIHVPSSSNSNSHAARMTLTPQFNNYVVSSAEPSGGSHRSVRGRHFGGGSSFPQDDKSFSDYGASFGAGSIHREFVGPRARSSSSFRTRHGAGRRPQRLEYYGMASKSQSHRYDDPIQRDGGADFVDYEEDYGPSRRSIGYQQRGRRSGQAAASRYRTHHHHYHQPEASGGSGSRSRPSNSIRDIINQQQAALFDDDHLDSLIGGGGGGGGSSSSGSQGGGRLQQVECCNNEARRGSRILSSGHQQQYSSAADPHLNADTEKREVQTSFDRGENNQADNYQPRELTKSQRHQTDLLQPEEFEGGEAELRHHKHAADLTNAYYDRDPLDDPVRHPQFTSDRHRDGRRLSNGRRLYLDEREILDDDEWWFDTIKSVSHISPPTTNTTNTTSTSTSTPTLTTLKPITISTDNNANVKSNATTLL